ncbi:phytoene desaturase family protein [Fibrobacterota bacterium]
MSSRGGKCLANHEVTQLIVENNKAVGVLINVNNTPKAYTEKFYAPVIVSDIGAYNTYTKLIPKDVHIPFAKKCVKIYNTSTCVALYVGLKDDAKSLGIKSTNHWIYDSYDHEKHYRNSTLVEGKPSACYLSFIFHKDLKVKAGTAVIISYVYYSKFKKWMHQTSGKRDKDYYELKDTISNGLINFVDRHYPGFRSMVDQAELATPLTSEHFTAHPEGTMYGLAATPERYRQKWLKVKTPLKGFYLTGTDISALGVVPSMMGGLATASYLNGPFGFFKLVREMRKNKDQKTHS